LDHFIEFGVDVVEIIVGNEFSNVSQAAAEVCVIVDGDRLFHCFALPLEFAL
jgi:hypothetical protein